MRTNYVPALVMLTAGFIDCVIAIVEGQALLPFVKQLLLVLIIFYVLGAIVQTILNRNFSEMDDFEDVELGEEVPQPEDEQEKEEEHEADSDEQEENSQE